MGDGGWAGDRSNLRNQAHKSFSLLEEKDQPDSCQSCHSSKNRVLLVCSVRLHYNTHRGEHKLHYTGHKHVVRPFSVCHFWLVYRIMMQHVLLVIPIEGFLDKISGMRNEETDWNKLFCGWHHIVSFCFGLVAGIIKKYKTHHEYPSWQFNVQHYLSLFIKSSKEVRVLGQSSLLKSCCWGSRSKTVQTCWFPEDDHTNCRVPVK